MTSSSRPVPYPSSLQCLDRHDNETLAVMHAGSAVDKVLRHLVKCSTMPDAGQMLDVLARIARRTQYSGIGNIQYKLATSGVLKARPSGAPRAEAPHLVPALSLLTLNPRPRR